MSKIPHDTFAHIDAGGFGVFAPDCEACLKHTSQPADKQAIYALRSQGLPVEEAIEFIERLRRRNNDDY